ncbi:MAG: hypothetical protein ACYS6W_03810 [Planctomycetota bacterium]
MKRKKILSGILLGVVLVGILCLFIFSAFFIVFGSSLNIGLPFGYYGKYNRVKYKLKSFPDIHIVGRYCHRDITLEDFGFVVKTKGGLHVMLDFTSDRKTDELFKRADGLLVQSGRFGKGLVYTFGSGERLEQAIGQEIRSATDVLKHFDKIAEIIETDRLNGVIDKERRIGTQNLLWITFPVSQMRLEALKL